MSNEKKRTIELLNLVVKFDDKGLVETFEDRFFPVIRGGKVRGRGEVETYRFEYLHFMLIEGVPIFAGRLLKFMTLEAEQDFDEASEKLIESTKTMPSVPSSFFVIDLTTHRLAYLSETRRAPSSNDLQYCISKLLNSDYAKRRKEAKSKVLENLGLLRVTKKVRDQVDKKIDSMVPKSYINLRSLPELKKVGKTLDPFEIITKLIIKPLPRNNELSKENSQFLRQYEKRQDKLGSISSSLVMGNTKDGLKKVATKDLVKQASTGNYAVKVMGKDSQGEDIDSDLQNISVKFREKIPAKEEVENRTKRLFKKLQDAFSKGYIVTVEVTAETRRLAIDIVNRLKV